MTTGGSTLRNELFHLRPTFRSRYRFTGGLLEVAPWIDVVLLFLLVLITLGATLKKPGLLVNLPVAKSASGVRYDAHVLTVPREGIYYFADQRVGWILLSERLREAASAYPGAELVLEVDGAVSHRAVTELYNVAADAGWTRIVLATRADQPVETTP